MPHRKKPAIPKRSVSVGVLLTLMVLATTVIGLAQAEVNKRSAVTANVIASLVADAKSVAPGDTVGLLFHQKIRGDWHTYWRNPGDSGQETAIDWSLPDGVHAGPIQWPVPRRFEVGDIANYGYADKVGLIVELAIPATWPVGTPIPIKADAAWLECESVCIPYYASFAFMIPTSRETVLSNDAAPMFAAARSTLPMPTNWRAAAQSQGNTVTIRIDGSGISPDQIKTAYFFPAEWGVIDHAADQQFVATEHGLTLSVAAGDLPAPPRLTGVLVLTEGEGLATRRSAYTIKPND